MESWNPYGAPAARLAPSAAVPSVTGTVAAAIASDLDLTRRSTLSFVGLGLTAAAATVAFAAHALHASTGTMLAAIAMAAVCLTPTWLLGRHVAAVKRLARDPSVTRLEDVTTTMLAFWRAAAVFVGTSVALAIVVRYVIGAILR